MTTTLTFPDAEAELLRSHYSCARVILEYGAGGSTRLAAQMPGKLVLSVESDRDFAIELQREIDASSFPSPAVIWHVNIGPTGAWGRPIDSTHWKRFHRYPLGIWDEPFFRHPDVILIDGRFRPACLATACMRITSPVTVLFDDYTNRPAYHVVEKLARPIETVGRMARFELTPGSVSSESATELIGMFSEATYATRLERYGDINSS